MDRYSFLPPCFLRFKLKLIEQHHELSNVQYIAVIIQIHLLKTGKISLICSLRIYIYMSKKEKSYNVVLNCKFIQCNYIYHAPFQV